MADPEALVRQLQGKSKIAFPFAAGWGDFGAGFEGASYSKHGRVVRLQGLVTKTGGAPAAGNVIGTLPLNFRPTADLVFVVLTTGGNIGRLDVKANGDVVWQGGNATETDYTSLSNVGFVAPA